MADTAKQIIAEKSLSPVVDTIAGVVVGAVLVKLPGVGAINAGVYGSAVSDMSKLLREILDGGTSPEMTIVKVSDPTFKASGRFPAIIYLVSLLTFKDQLGTVIIGYSIVHQRFRFFRFFNAHYRMQEIKFRKDAINRDIFGNMQVLLRIGRFL